MENTDDKLWQLATKRVQFRAQVLTYLAVNAFLWCIWYFTKGYNPNDSFPWPAWVSLGWGFGLLMKYIRTFHLSDDEQIQKEYDKLKNSK